MNIFAALMILFIAALGLSACSTPHRSYDAERTRKSLASTDAPLAVIEFDERGDYWSPRQYAEAEKNLIEQKDPILITYVHGWTHDGHPDDNDLKSFQLFLNTLNRALRGRVCGVYIGWRGASIKQRGPARWVSQPWAGASFWGRKRVTDSMAGVPLTNTLWSLASTARERKGHAILVGHSFGGRILERTLGTAAIAQMRNEKAMPYDLTFLVNPATESLYARQLKLALHTWNSSQPAIVVLAAEDDSATGFLWPLAHLLPDRTKERSYQAPGNTSESQKSYVKATVGTDSRQFTHALAIGAGAPVLRHTNQPLRNLFQSSATFGIRLRDNRKGEVAQCSVDPVVATSDRNQISSKAYWVVPLPKVVLSGHGGDPDENGIFCDSMIDLMSGVIGKVGAVRKEAPKVRPSNPADTPKSEAVLPKPEL